MLSPEWTSATIPLNYLLFEVDDFVTFCSFQRPLPAYSAVWAIFLRSMNYLADTVYIASLASLAKPFYSNTFLLSTP